MKAIDQAIQDLLQQRSRIDSALRVLRELSGNGGGGSRRLSAEGRRRIAEAQTRRWEKVRAAKAKRK